MIAIDLPVEDKWRIYNGSSPLNSVFNAFYPISAEVEKQINKHTFPVTFKKGKFLVSPVDRNNYLYLIIKGVVRGYIKDENHEITTWIATENQIVGTIKNLWLKGDSDEYLQALENLELIAIPHSLSDYLYDNYPEANIVARKILANFYRSAEERAYLCRISSAEKRYLRFLKTYPNLIQRISLKYIASFLGIRLETLSRIRSKV